MFLTDGMLDRNASRLDLPAAVLGGAQMHPPGAVQYLVAAVLHASGRQLEDDTTGMCVDWHGGPPRDRTSDSGANR